MKKLRGARGPQSAALEGGVAWAVVGGLLSPPGRSHPSPSEAPPPPYAASQFQTPAPGSCSQNPAACWGRNKASVRSYSHVIGLGCKMSRHEPANFSLDFLEAFRNTHKSSVDLHVLLPGFG